MDKQVPHRKSKEDKSARSQRQISASEKELTFIP